LQHSYVRSLFVLPLFQLTETGRDALFADGEINEAVEYRRAEEEKNRQQDNLDRAEPPFGGNQPRRDGGEVGRGEDGEDQPEDSF
jgi:hypothetical protein